MRHLSAAGLLLLASLWMIPTARAQDTALSPADRSAIAGVITRQIEAFGRDDAPAAFGHASPNIQALFGTPENFLAMVKRGYAPLVHPSQVQMRDVLVQDGQLIQRVDIIGPDGRAQLALYTMERGEDGTWRIAGCVLTRSDMVGT